MSIHVFPDNTVLCNFACIARTDVLVEHLRGRGRWVEAVAAEARRSAAYLPDLGSLVGEASPLGEPIRIEDPDDVEAVDRMRRVVFGGEADAPLQHLGEAQTCHLLLTDLQLKGATWVTDDRDAFRYARQEGLDTRSTVDIFRSMVADGDLDANTAHRLLSEIVEMRPGLDVPGRPDGLR